MRRLSYFFPLALIGGFFVPEVLISQGTHGSPIIERVAGLAPEIGVESQAVQGEAIYSEFDFARQKAARLLEEVRIDRKTTLSAGTIMDGYSVKKGAHFCVLNSKSVFGIPTTYWLCLVPGQDQKFVTMHTLADGAVGVRSKPLKTHPAFEWTYRSMSADVASSYGSGSFFRKEIVYQGAAGKILRLLYREYTDDLARPAFTQELTYDYAEGESLTVAVKGARLEIIEAGNSGIRYRVTKGFEEDP